MAEERVQRRLAAIFAADVVGYSRMMGADEAGTLARIKSLRQDLFDPKVSEHAGRVVKSMGDGVLIEFASAVDAVQCAIDVQQSLARRNADVPAESAITLRIGINLGDIIVDGADLYGDGVNVAARLEGFAEPGGVCISAIVRESVKNKLDVTFADQGEQRFKNIADPVHVFAVDNAGIATDAQLVDAIFRRPAVAVLPFENLSGDPEQEFFADGLTEDLTTALSLWRTFPVIARNSTFAYKGKSPDLRKVGDELGARYIVEGSVRRAGLRLRVTAQLIDARSGHHVWAQKYDRELADLFDLQDELTKQIAAIVAPELERAEQNRILADARPVRLEAWELLQRGIAIFYKFGAEANAEAKALLSRATEIDPNYSQAYSWLTFVNMRDFWLGFTDDRAGCLKEMDANGRKAAELDNSDALAHIALALAHTWNGRLDPAQKEAQIAVDLNPNSAAGYAMLGHVLGTVGKLEEGVRNSKLAQILNPIDPRNAIYAVHIATAYLIAGEYRSATEWADDAIRRGATFAEAHFLRAVALGHLGELVEAKAALDECESLTPGFVADFHASRPYLSKSIVDKFFDGVRKVGWEG